MLSTGRIVAIVVVVSVCVVAAVVIPTAIVLTNNKKVNDEWNAFKDEFNKTYATEDEDELRKENWLKNKQDVEEHNKLYEEGKVTYQRVLTADSDMSEAARDSLYRLCGRQSVNVTGLPYKYKYKLRKRLTRQAIPDRFDWRERNAVTEVKNQYYPKFCGSCWAFAAVALLESYSFLKEPKTSSIAEYSEQYLVDCDRNSGNEGCKGGSEDEAVNYVKQNGIPYRGNYEEYHATDKTECDRSAKKQSIDIGNLRALEGEEQMRIEVAVHGPITVGVRVDEKFKEYMKTGVGEGTFTTDGNCPATKGHHALTIIGYGTDGNGIDYWLIKNSMGVDVGDEGYIRVERGKNVCGIADDTFTIYP